MKKIITIITLFIAVSSFAQLKVSNVEEMEVIGEYKLLGKSYAKISKGNKLCFLTYRDEKFESIDNYKTFAFRYEDLDALYDLFTNFEGIEKGDEKKVELEDGDVLNIRYKKSLGIMYFTVFHTDRAGVIGMMRSLTPKQIKGLFGK